MLFSKYNSNGWYYHGSHTENWATFDGDDLWRSMADEAVENFEDYFTTYPEDAAYIWGYNLLTEGPADKDIDIKYNLQYTRNIKQTTGGKP